MPPHLVITVHEVQALDVPRVTIRTRYRQADTILSAAHHCLGITRLIRLGRIRRPRIA